MAVLSIGEVARQTGIRASALRSYEQEGILPPAARVGGRRRYDSTALRRIGVLRYAQQAGFTLDEIKTLFHGFDETTPFGDRWRALTRLKFEELDALGRRIERMRTALVRASKCGCRRIEDCSLEPNSTAEDSR